MNRKTIKNIGLICILLLVIVIINIDKVNSIIVTGTMNITNVRGNDINNPIKILEIQPGDIFRLTKTKGKSIDPGQYDENKSVIPKEESIEEKINGKYVQVTHISMPELVSKVDEINGQYDIVVIGRDNIKSRGNNPWDEVKGLSSIYNYNTKYLDYTNPFSTVIEGKSALPDEYNQVEYYSENDLTEKRLKEIQSIIESDQLIYIDNNIGKENYTEKIGWTVENKEIKNTNLYSLYNSYDKPNFRKEDFNNINLEKIIEDYNNLSEDIKRPYIYNQKDIFASIDENKNIKINATIYEHEDIEFKLYLDKDGDGLFKEKEKTPIIQTNVKENHDKYKTYEVSYNLEDSLWGYLGWKLEIIKNNNVKSNIEGNIIVDRPIDIPIQQIKVLQLFPSYWNSYSEEDKPKEFKDNPRFDNLLNEISDDYNIEIVRKRINDFDKEILNGSDKLNGNYNSVIIGFGKNDSIGSYNDKLSEKTIEEIKEYIKSGQSIIFTADAMASKISKKEDGTSTLTQAFRDIIGLSRFKDPFNEGELGLYGETIKHIPLEGEKYTAGLSAANRESGNKYAKIINKTQATSYPFDLNNELIEISTYDVSPVYQLNLEDEDVVPIYNHTANGYKPMNSGDSRNFYHTYSKGNITYSLSLPNFDNMSPENKFPEDQLKLFINTIINSQGSSNNAPIIQSRYLNNEILNNEIVSIKAFSEGLTFTTKALDLDGDNVKLKVKLDDEENEFISTDGFKPQGTELSVRISKSKIDEVYSRENKTLKIKVIAEDEKGAVSESNYIFDLSQTIQIRHGIYMGIENGKINIDEDNKTFSKGSVVTMAANSKINNATDLILEIEDGLTLIENPKIYKIIDNELIFLGEMIDYKYHVNQSNAGDILIVYSIKLPYLDDKLYTNNIVVGEVNKKAMITLKGELPDLF